MSATQELHHPSHSESPPVEFVYPATLDELNASPSVLEKGILGKEAISVPISDAELEALGGPQEHFMGDGEGYDWRSGTPLLTITTGGNTPGEQVTYRLLAEFTDKGPSGRLYLEGLNPAGERFDFALVGSPEENGKHTNFGRSYKAGEEVGQAGREIPLTVSRNAIGVSYLRNKENDGSRVMIGTHTETHTRVAGASYEEPAAQETKNSGKVGLAARLAGKITGRSVKIG